MGKFKVRYTVIKPQKGGHALYYWQPARVLRQFGFNTRRLAERTNRSPPDFARRRHNNATTSQRSIWKFWRSAVA